MGKRAAYIGRIIACLVALAFLGGGTYLFVHGWRLNRKLDEAKEAELIRLDVNLSQPGVYKGTLLRKFAGSHHEVLRLFVTPGFASEEEATTAFDGLEAYLILRDARGGAVFQDQIASDYFRYDPSLGSAQAFVMLSRALKGEYAFTLEVKKGAAALTGRKQTLVCKHHMCGVEYLSAAILELLGAAAWVVGGLILSAILLWAHLRKRRRGRKLPGNASS